jgi:hypothetical protein
LSTDTGSLPALLGASNLSVSFPKTESQLLAECIAAFNDVNETDTLLNILEAGQTYSGVLGVIDIIQRIMSTKLRRQKKFSLSDLSNTFLATEFGFKPLISDLRKVFNGVRAMRGRLKKLAEAGTRPYTVTRKSAGTLSVVLPSNGEYSGQSNPLDGTKYHCGHYATKMPVLIVGVRGVRRPKYNTAAFQQLDYLMGRFIATGPASLAWEKLRFSFVFDWFVDISSILNRLDSELVGFERTIDKSWTSTAYTGFVPTYFHKYNGNDFDEYAGQQVSLMSYNYYHRKSIDPSYSIREAGRFGKKQSVLSLALLHQLVAKLKR